MLSTLAPLVNEIQEVYRQQGVNSNDKHFEGISRRTMRWIKIEDIGDPEFLLEEVLDKSRFKEENARVLEAGGRPAWVRPCCWTLPSGPEGKRDHAPSAPCRNR